MTQEQIERIIQNEAHKELVIVNIGTDEKPDYVIRGVELMAKSLVKLFSIHDVSFSLWEYGTCLVTSPVTDEKTIHKSRRNKETKVVQFYVDDKTCDNGEGYWLDLHKGWWNNFIPTN